MLIHGVCPALVTPFTSNAEVDYQGLKQNLEFQIQAGVNAVLPLGTTGETPTISKSEQQKIIEFVIETTAERVPVMVGTGTYNTQETITLTKAAEAAGAQCALIVQPYYSKPTQEGIYRHFAAVADACSLPILVYNIKGRTGVNIETDTMLRIAKIPSVIGVKEASGDIGQMADVIQQTELADIDFTVLSGDDALTLPLMALGGKGVVSVVANLLPGEMLKLVQELNDGNFVEARKLHYELLPLFKASFLETNPIPIKTAMDLCGMPAGPFRLPICEMSEENKEKLKTVLANYEVLKS